MIIATTVSVGFGMNVAWITTLSTVVCLLEFLFVANVDGIFFSSLLSSKVKTNFPTTGKLGNEDAKVEDDHRQESKEKPHIIIILADDMVSDKRDISINPRTTDHEENHNFN